MLPWLVRPGNWRQSRGGPGGGPSRGLFAELLQHSSGCTVEYGGDCRAKNCCRGQISFPEMRQWKWSSRLTADLSWGLVDGRPTKWLPPAGLRIPLAPGEAPPHMVVIDSAPALSPPLL